MEVGTSALATYQSLNRLATGAPPGRTPLVSSQPPADSATPQANSAPANSVSPGPSGSGGSADVISGRTNAPLQTTSGQAVSDKAEQRVEQQTEQQQIEHLAKTDREVRAHEAAHAAVGGQHAGSPTYQFVNGPDGRLYAVAGEVSIDTRPVPNDPEATIEKAQTLIQAATAPANPSAQDLRVAAQAQALLVEAQAELATLREQAEAQQAAQQQTVQQQSAEKETSETDPGNPRSDDKLLTSGPQGADKEQENGQTNAVDQRLERAREQREAFAEQLQELNRRLTRIQQQMIDTGATTGLTSTGSFIDIEV